MIDQWRKRHGLDYRGWVGYLVRRSVRRAGLSWCLPLDWQMEDHDDGVSELVVSRWGRRTIERWRWPEYRDKDILDRLSREGMKHRDLYLVIRAEARLVERLPL